MRACGVTPVCPAGCPTGKQHGTDACPRLSGRETVSSVDGALVLEAHRGLDFFRVWASDFGYMAYAVATFCESHNVYGANVAIRTGVCVLPRTYGGQVVPATFSTGYVDADGLHKYGEMPLSFSLTDLCVVSTAKCGDTGKPLESFIGIPPEQWERIWASACARRRYACLLFGHPNMRPPPSYNGQQKMATAGVCTKVGASAEPALYVVLENQKVQCAHCGVEHDTLAAYREACVPDARC